MLDGLDRIDWARLGHAYGPAGDVPEQIRALCSADPDVRVEARWQLYGNIFHQGTRYEATAYAVPFLIEVLGAPDTADRVELLGLLGSIAIGYDETWLPAGLPIAEHRVAAEGGEAILAAGPHPGDEDFDEDEGDFAYVESLTPQEQERLHAHVEVAAYDAVRAGVPLFRALLNDPAPDVRVHAAYVLGWFPEDAVASLSALETLTADLPAGQDETVLGTALVASALLGRPPDAAALTDERPLVRWGAAIAAGTVGRANTTARAVEELLHWTGSATEADRRIPFLDGDLAGYAGLVLGLLGTQHADATFEALLSRIPTVSGIEALPVVGEALRAAFPAGPRPPETSFTALDERQRRLVTTLAASPDTWLLHGTMFANFSGLIHGYGLPGSHQALRAFAGQKE
ncbi:HEAT repeat domain-containing protein [Actinoplanes sp. CA-054009]